MIPIPESFATILLNNLEKELETITQSKTRLEATIATIKGIDIPTPTKNTNNTTKPVVIKVKKSPKKKNKKKGDWGKSITPLAPIDKVTRILTEAQRPLNSTEVAEILRHGNPDIKPRHMKRLLSSVSSILGQYTTNHGNRFERVMDNDSGMFIYTLRKTGGGTQ